MCRGRYAETWTSTREHGGERDTTLRASDADRERVAEALRGHYADGRLTPEELDERLDRVYAAKTLGDLDAPVRDLPRNDHLRPPHAGHPGVRFLLAHPLRLALLVGLIFLLTSPVGAPFWPGWFLVAWLAFPGWFGRRRRWPSTLP